MAEYLTDKDIKSFYDSFETPKHVIAHCAGVTHVALGIAEALNAKGYSLDLGVIRGAGLTHDIARLLPEHGGVGADALAEKGFIRESEVVRYHMYHEFNDIEHLTEIDMVCLGDRLVKEDTFVGMEARFQYIIDKAPKTHERSAILARKKGEMRAFLTAVEELIGMTVDDMFEGFKAGDKWYNELYAGA